VSILFSEQQIQGAVKVLAREVSKEYRGQELHLVGILSGCICFLADLLREIHEIGEVDIVTHVLSISSYRGTTRGQLQTFHEPKLPLSDKRVLLVDTVLDTGKTMVKAMGLIKDAGAADIKFVALVDKRKSAYLPDSYLGVGFEVSNDPFIIGYGLDVDGRYRGQKFISVFNKYEPII
jgi:hypoxanthine phosphoribosyltransferase